MLWNFNVINWLSFFAFISHSQCESYRTSHANKIKWEENIKWKWEIRQCVIHFICFQLNDDGITNETQSLNFDHFREKTLKWTVDSGHGHRTTYLSVIESDRSIANFTADISEHPPRSITWLLWINVIVIENIAGVGHTNKIGRQPGEENSNGTDRTYRTGDDVLAMRSQLPPNTHYDCPHPHPTEEKSK